MQSTRLAVAALIAAFSIGVAAQGGAEKAQMEFDAAEIKGDKAVYNRLLTDDFTWVSASGRLQDKKTLVAGIQPVTGTPGKNTGIDVRPYPGGAVMIFTRHQPTALRRECFGSGFNAEINGKWPRTRGYRLVNRQRWPRNPRPRCLLTQDQRRRSTPSNRRSQR
jgi:hypothetical protein